MQQKKPTAITAIALAFITSLSFSCQKETTIAPVKSEEPTSRSSKKPADPGFAENNMVMYWNEKTTTVLSVPMTQPRRSRLFAITQIAVHDALNAIKPKYERYALLNVREQFANPDAAIAGAAYWVIKGLNLQRDFPIDTWYNESLATIPDGEGKNLGTALGKQAADAILADRANDGLSLVLVTSLVPADGDDPGEYRVTLPWANPALNLPHLKNIPNWGTVMKPFVLQSNDRFRPAGPDPVNSTAYTQDFNEVKSKGARVGHSRTTEETEIANFWSDVRPSLIWNRLARNIINNRKIDAWKTARLFALMHTAMADGINSVMEAKYYFYYWRPETAVRLADNDGNPNTTGDANWLPSVTEVPNTNPLMTVYTPPIPEYPSSYTMYGGVVAEVLKQFFGTDEITFDLTSFTLPSTTRHYSSLSQASRENSVARICMGSYFRKGALDGEEQGKQIANYVFNHSFKESDE